MKDGGTLQIGSGGVTGSLGAGNVSVAATTALAFNRSDDITISNVVSGAGGLSKLGSNTLTLTGNNSYSGATSIVAGGTLQIGAGGTSGQLGTGATTNAGTLVFNRSDSLTVASAIGGAGTVNQVGDGTTSFTNTNTYTGTTTISAGTLSIGTGGTGGTFGTGTVPDERIQAAVLEVFDLRPAAIISDLQLLRPIYSQTAAYGHFGRELPDFTWERTDRADALKAAVGA